MMPELKLRPIDSLPNEDGRVVLLVQGDEVLSVVCNAGDIMKGGPYYTWTPRDERSMMLGTVAVDVFDGWLDPRDVAKATRPDGGDSLRGALEQCRKWMLNFTTEAEPYDAIMESDELLRIICKALAAKDGER